MDLILIHNLNGFVFVFFLPWPLIPARPIVQITVHLRGQETIPQNFITRYCTSLSSLLWKNAINIFYICNTSQCSKENFLMLFLSLVLLKKFKINFEICKYIFSVNEILFQYDCILTLYCEKRGVVHAWTTIKLLFKIKCFLRGGYRR